MNNNSKLTQVTKNMPEVSIVVPVYGVEKYLQKCIDSLVNQTFNNIEIILVDDGSRDSSGEICDRNALLHPTLIKVLHQKNTGLGGARNAGIKMASGRYTMFVDSDDFLRSDTVEIAYGAISTNDVDMVAFGIHFINENNRIIKSSFDGTIFNQKINLSTNKRILLNSPSAWNKIYKTNLFSSNDIWFPARAWHEDLRTTLKIYAAIDSVVYIQEHLYYYVQRNDSITHNVDVERNKDILDAIDDIEEYFKDNNLFIEYYDELEYITILNMYNAASARVALIDPKNHLLSEFRERILSDFPEYRNNKYIRDLSIRQKTLFFLVEYKLYKIIRLLGILRDSYDNRGVKK
ncbi:MAG: hypothetical protein JWN28_114 [Candidatus Saccharibacteria bacterium]|nr:hypothetical protein [Candidatus Saccharibacteria bacterium]